MRTGSLLSHIAALSSSSASASASASAAESASASEYHFNILSHLTRYECDNLFQVICIPSPHHACHPYSCSISLLITLLQAVSSCSLIANFNIVRHASLSSDSSTCIATISGSLTALPHPRWIVEGVSGGQPPQASAAAAAAIHDMHVTASLLSLVSCSWGR